MRPVLVIAVVLLLVLVGAPLVGAMAMPFCPECPSVGWGPMALCLAVLSVLSLVAPAALGSLARRERALRALLLVTTLERPPRPA